MGSAPFLYTMFTTMNPVVFYIAAFLQSLFGSSALGAAAATSQDLVLPRMRGTATATFFLSTTLVGLALGPYMAGQVSSMTVQGLPTSRVSASSVIRSPRPALMNSPPPLRLDNAVIIRSA